MRGEPCEYIKYQKAFITTCYDDSFWKTVVKYNYHEKYFIQKAGN